MKKRVTTKQDLVFIGKSKKDKKTLMYTIIACFLILLLAFIIKINITANVIDPTDSEDPLGIGFNPENLNQDPEQIKNKTTAYLKQEWENILLNNKYIGPFLSFYKDKISPYSTPIVKGLLGIEPSISWLFLLTLMIYITFIVFVYRIISVYSTFSPGVSWIIAICLITIFSALGISRNIAGQIINAASLLTSWWMQLIVVILVIALLIFMNVFSKQFGEMLEKMKENREKMKQEMDVLEAKIKSDSAYKTTKAVVKSFED